MLHNWTTHLWRGIVLRQLQRLRIGCLRIREGDGELMFGDPNSDLQASLQVHDANFYSRVIQRGGLGAAESYLDGEWSSNDVMKMIQLFIRNPSLSQGIDTGWARVSQYAARWDYWLRRNTRSNAKRNIHAHYDVGNDFFSLFLDETLSYSCGVFEDANSSMQDASLAKIRLVCRKLQLQPSDEVLEIGTGWGSLALHIANEFGCRVKTTTISREQFALARQRVREQKLDQLVSVQLEDYRDLQGKYHKLVSVEMIEAVGQAYLDRYFEQCSRLLRADGLMLLQAIVIRDQVLSRHASSVDFIGKYIFPGGFLPSIGLISDSVARVTDLRICGLEELSPHYVQTLHAWRKQFWSNIAEVRRLGFDDRFVRMWDYYFQYCAAAFAERQVNVVQILLAKPEYQLRRRRGPQAGTAHFDRSHSHTAPQPLAIFHD